ncbi:hypothetical protein RTP6_004920 [Batrachochytrium dendrobatidis]
MRLSDNPATMENEAQPLQDPVMAQPIPTTQSPSSTPIQQQSPPIRRKMSIAERATAAIESRLSASKDALRRTSTRDSCHSSNANIVNVGTAMSSVSPSSLSYSSLVPSIDDQNAFSMNPEDYELGQVIGQGSSASVYIAKYKPLQRAISMKVIDLDLFERNQIDELRREIQIMSLSKHPNLLPVYGSFVNGSKLFIVTPFLAGGSCLDIMKTSFKEGFDEVSIATILKQALQGLDYLHKNGLIHRDVKAGNLLIDKDGLVQLADFGVSSSLMDAGDRRGLRKTFVGTPCWMAPEVMEQSGYNYKADIWSFGITSLELANAQAPYAKFPPLKVLMLTLQNEPPTLDRDSTRGRFSRQFKDMIDMCLKKDPARRPTTEKLLQHSFFKFAKKNSYLVSNVLSNMVPITERQHLHKIPALQDTVHSSDSHEWDFDDASESNPLLLSQMDSASDSVSDIPSNSNIYTSQPSCMTSHTAATASRSLQSDNLAEYNPLAGRAKGVSFRETPAEFIETLPRKSRFIVDSPYGVVPSAAPQGLDSPLEISLPDQCNPILDEQPQSASIQPCLSPPQTASQQTGSSLAGALAAEVKKGRFSVVESCAPACPANGAPSDPANACSATGCTTMDSRALSMDRKASRFAVQCSQSPVCTPLTQTPGSQDADFTGDTDTTQEPTRLVRKPTGGHASYINGQSSNQTNGASVATSNTNQTGSLANFGSTVSDKRGRFQISSYEVPSATSPGNPYNPSYNSLPSTLISPGSRFNLLSAALTPFPMDGTTEERLDAFIKISEAQRKLIHNVMPILTRHGLNPYQNSSQEAGASSFTANHSRSASYSDADRGAFVHQMNLESKRNTAATCELEQRLTDALKELNALRIENEELRKTDGALSSSRLPPP